MMSTGSEMPALARPPVWRRFSLPRFPARWAVESAAAEGIFARLLWLLVPLQYYVVTNLPRGLSGDDVIAAVAVSLMSVVVIFILRVCESIDFYVFRYESNQGLRPCENLEIRIHSHTLSCAVAWLASVVRPLDPESGDTFSGRVRMWVVALMICISAGYLLLALSLAANNVIAYFCGLDIYSDPVTGGLKWPLKALGLGSDTINVITPWLQALSNLVYVFAGLLLTALAHRALRRGAARPPAPQEPSMISVGLIAAVVMSAANFLATVD